LKQADVVIIGAGVNGTSTAFHLAKAGVKHIVVVERQHVGAGATGKSGALVRTNYANEPETRLALESMKYFKHWDDLVGGECGYQPVGLLFFTDPQYRHHLEHNIALHRQLGVNTRLITPAEAQELDPSLYVGDVDCVGYEPESGYADPNATAYSFADAASQRGVDFWLETTATRILTEGGRIVGVETTRGTIQTPMVVVVAGAWAKQLFQPLGIDLGLVARRGRVVVFRWARHRSPQHLTYLDRLNHLWARPIDQNCTLIGVDRDELPEGNPDAYHEAAEQEYITLCREYIARRFPIMHQATLRGSWACMMMFSPDRHPVIGQLPQYEGLYCMTGDSGTSFKTGPAIGKCLAELMTEGQATTVDLAAFRPTRFAEGQPWSNDFFYGNEGGRISR
jgi:sarcosine oxidase subunit beta